MASSKGVPLQGDRSAWDAVNYPEKHSKDIDDETYDYHTPLSNYDATEAPGVGDDSADGYAPGSRWVDVTNDKAYVCLDATVGAAVWVEVMERGDYDEDADGLIDTAHGGTELDTSSSDGIPHLSSGTWSILKRLSPGADSELTIASGIITATQLYHRIDTETDAASDDLDTINGLANDGELLLLHPEHNDRDVVLKHGTGNIYIPGGSDLTLDHGSYHVLLIYDAESTNWCVVGGGSSGGGGASDAADLTFTPTVLTDWDADTDPGNADGALDQLAERVDDNEIEIATKGDMAKADYDTNDDGVVDGADEVDGVATAGNSKYYGTDASGTPGFHDLPSNELQVDQSGGTSDTYGVLAGTINGSNTTFTTSTPYETGTLKVYLNGQLLTQGSAEDWVETTPGSGTFDFNTAPESGDEITAYYATGTGAGGSGGADILEVQVFM